MKIDEMNITDVKEFLLWCKKNGIAEVACGDVQVIFSQAALLPIYEEPEPPPYVTQEENDEKQKQEEELLFWSSK